MANTGKPSEKIFDEFWKAHGKKACVIPFEDAASLFGKNKRKVANSAKPCDRLLIYAGRVEFVEIKSTTHEKRFSFSMIRPTQLGFAKRITAAGGTYDFWIHSLASDRWYVVPARIILNHEQRSLTWDELKSYEYRL